MCVRAQSLHDAFEPRYVAGPDLEHVVGPWNAYIPCLTCTILPELQPPQLESDRPSGNTFRKWHACGSQQPSSKKLFVAASPFKRAVFCVVRGLYATCMRHCKECLREAKSSCRCLHRRLRGEMFSSSVQHEVHLGSSRKEQLFGNLVVHEVHFGSPGPRSHLQYK